MLGFWFCRKVSINLKVTMFMLSGHFTFDSKYFRQPNEVTWNPAFFWMHYRIFSVW